MHQSILIKTEKNLSLSKSAGYRGSIKTWKRKTITSARIEVNWVLCHVTHDKDLDPVPDVQDGISCERVLAVRPY